MFERKKEKNYENDEEKDIKINKDRIVNSREK